MNNLRVIRKANDMTLSDLATIIQVKENTISQWETGKRQPDIATLIALAKHFGVTVDYLVGNDNALITISNDPNIDKELVIPLIKKVTKLDSVSIPLVNDFIDNLIKKNVLKKK